MDALTPILSRIEAIKAEKARLDAEIGDLLIAARVFKRYAVEANSPVQATPRNGSKVDFIMRTLADAPAIWMTASEIRDAYAALKGVPVPIGSISPLLTKMKGDGKIVRDGLKIALAERANMNEAPDAEAREAS